MTWVQDYPPGHDADRLAAGLHVGVDCRVGADAGAVEGVGEERGHGVRPGVEVGGGDGEVDLLERLLEEPLLGAHQRRGVGEVGEVAQTEGADVGSGSRAARGGAVFVGGAGRLPPPTMGAITSPVDSVATPDEACDEYRLRQARAPRIAVATSSRSCTVSRSVT